MATRKSNNGSKGFIRVRPVKAPAPAPQSEDPMDLKALRVPVVDQHLFRQMQDRYELKAQELCDSIRHQYELMLQRQETKHERAIQQFQLKLQEVCHASIDRSNHQTLVAAMRQDHAREKEELIAFHHNELETQTLVLRQEHREALEAQRERWREETECLVLQLQHMQLQVQECQHTIKEKELVELNLRNELEDVQRALTLANGRFEEACQHIVTLKTQLKKMESYTSKIADEKAKKAAFRENYQQLKATMAESKAEARKRIELLEKELQYTQKQLTTEQEAHKMVLPQIPALQEQIHELEKQVLEAKGRETTQLELREVERMQFQKGTTVLEASWKAERQRVDQLQSDLKNLEKQLQDVRDTHRELVLRHELDQKAHAEAKASLQQQLQAAEKTQSRTMRKLKQLQAAYEELQQDQHVAKLLTDAG